MLLTAKLHDGSAIDVEVDGDGPVVLLPVNPTPIEGDEADALRAWGADPALGRSLIDGLRDAFRVVAFDYEGHLFATPKPHTLTPDNVARDVLAVADAVGAERFAYYGYSLHAVNGLQLAIRTDRLSALVVGGWPPVGGPYAEMLRVTAAAHEMSKAPRRSPETEPVPGDWSTAEMTMSEPQTRQFVTLYQGLQQFDDHAAQAQIGCPRVCFAGSDDEIAYDEPWGGVVVNMAAPLIRHREELERCGWEVHVLDGLDHMQAMQATTVLPILRPWLASALSAA